MPAANWIAAAKKTPNSPIVVVEVESADAVAVRQNLASDWNAGTDAVSIEVVTNADGTATVRPEHFVYHNDDVTWVTNQINNAYTDSYAKFTTPAVETYLESITAKWTALMGTNYWSAAILGITANCTLLFPGDIRKTFEAEVAVSSPQPLGPGYELSLPNIMRFFAGGTLTTVDGVTTQTGAYPANTECIVGSAGVPNIVKAPYGYGEWQVLVTFKDSGGTVFSQWRPDTLWPQNDAVFVQVMRAKTGSFYTKVFDLGIDPAAATVFTCKASTPGDSAITFVAEYSDNGTDWLSAGNVIDGMEMTGARYYRFLVTVTCGLGATTYMNSTSWMGGGIYIPELHEIKVIGGNALYEYYSNSVDVTIPGYTVRNHLKSVSGTAAKIDLKGKPTVGDLSFTLHWTRETGAMVVATNRKRAIRAFIGFSGLAWADYEPYFCGLWDSVSIDQKRREIQVRVFDVWKLFKKKIPEISISQEKASISSYLVNGNIIDAITDLVEKIGVPGRFIDSAAFTSLKAASFAIGWDVSRLFNEQENSDDLLAELAVSAGLFLLPGANGKLTPVHYDTVIAAAVTATLDAGRHHFTVGNSDFGETITQVRIFYGTQLTDDISQVENYPKCYLNVNADAETDRDERIPLEWLDKWRLAVGTANATENPITWLADRLLEWYCPTRTIDSKTVATAPIKVSVNELPLSYLNLKPGTIVAVDNLRIPAPIEEWEGFSDGMKFLVMSQKVNSNKWTVSLDLRQVGPVSYNSTPNWYTYANDTLPALANPQTAPLTIDYTHVDAPPSAITFTPAVYDINNGADTRVDLTVSWTPGGFGFVRTQLQYRLTGTEEWSPMRETYDSYLTIEGIAGGDYDFQLREINNLGVFSAWASDTTFVPNSDTTVPTVTGLEVFNQGNDSTFTGSNVVLRWHRVTPRGTVEAYGPAGATKPKAWFRYYELKIYTSADVLLRTEYLSEESYTYTHEKNHADNGGTPVRSLKFSLRALSTWGVYSATVALLSCSNPAPVTPTVTASSFYNGYAVLITPVADIDGPIYYLIHAGTTADFTPTEGNLINRGPETSFMKLGDGTTTTKYIKVAAVDAFGEDALNYSDAVAVTPTLILKEDIAIGATTDQVVDELVSVATLYDITSDVVPDVLDTTNAGEFLAASINFAAGSRLEIIANVSIEEILYDAGTTPDEYDIRVMWKEHTGTTWTTVGMPYYLGTLTAGTTAKPFQNIVLTPILGDENGNYYDVAVCMRSYYNESVDRLRVKISQGSLLKITEFKN